MSSQPRSVPCLPDLLYVLIAVLLVSMPVAANVPPGTSIDYWLSNDGGNRWYLVRPGALFEFPAPGDLLHWKAELRSLSPARTPRIDQIRILVDDADLDGDPDATDPCTDTDGDGYHNPGFLNQECPEDCSPNDARIYPGAVQLCDGLDNDCSEASSIPDEIDNDGDGYVECGPWVGDVPDVVGGDDCNDAASITYPGCPEINNGVDDQCPGDLGYGFIDEISEVCGFYNESDDTEVSCPEQNGATAYEAVRSDSPGFCSGCACAAFTPEPAEYPDGQHYYINDTAAPNSGDVFYYLMRSISPAPVGSWGPGPLGSERTVDCP